MSGGVGRVTCNGGPYPICPYVCIAECVSLSDFEDFTTLGVQVIPPVANARASKQSQLSTSEVRLANVVPSNHIEHRFGVGAIPLSLHHRTVHRSVVNNDQDNRIVKSGFDLDVRDDAQFPCIILFCRNDTRVLFELRGVNVSTELFLIVAPTTKCHGLLSFYIKTICRQ